MNRTGENLKTQDCPICGIEDCYEGEYSCRVCGYIFKNFDPDIEAKENQDA